VKPPRQQHPAGHAAIEKKVKRRRREREPSEKIEDRDTEQQDATRH
jgi:hypothetical protein